MSDIILYVFCIMAANHIYLFQIQPSSYKVVNEEWHIFVIIFTTALKVICIIAYIISFDVWCSIFELTPDTSILYHDLLYFSLE